MLFKDKIRPLKKQIGNFGQQVAADFLLGRGYKILAQNFFTPQGEIDLILEKDGQLVFVEVKTRLSDKFGLPEEAVDNKKREKMHQAGLKYLEEKQIKSDNFRFDIVAVEIDKDKKNAKIRHHKGMALCQRVW